MSRYSWLCLLCSVQSFNLSAFENEKKPALSEEMLLFIAEMEKVEGDWMDIMVMAELAPEQLPVTQRDNAESNEMVSGKKENAKKQEAKDDIH